MRLVRVPLPPYWRVMHNQDRRENLCTAHHHLLHEGGWSVQLHAHGALGFTASDGRALPPEPPREMVEDAVAFLRERAADQGLELGAETNCRSGTATWSTTTGPWGR
jgi:hypothetical protein